MVPQNTATPAQHMISAIRVAYGVLVIIIIIIIIIIVIIIIIIITWSGSRRTRLASSS